MVTGADFNGDGRAGAVGPGFAALAVGACLSPSGETCNGEAARTSGTAADAVAPDSTAGGPDVGGAAGAGGVEVFFADESVPSAGGLRGAGGIGVAVGGNEIVFGVPAGCVVCSGVFGGADADGTGPP